MHGPVKAASKSCQSRRLGVRNLDPSAGPVGSLDDRGESLSTDNAATSLCAVDEHASGTPRSISVERRPWWCGAIAEEGPGSSCLSRHAWRPADPARATGRPDVER